MSDRELLELAAKAAGLYVKYPVLNPDDECIGLKVKPSKDASRQTISFWNPRDNDGDALRLLARLPSLWSLKLMFGQPHIEMAVAWGSNDVIANQSSHSDRNRAEAIRHAIFDAAVEIGRRMP